MSNAQNKEYVRLVNTNELPPGKMKKVSVSGKDVLVANSHGAYCAISNSCPHAGGSLADGTLVGNIVTCPRHKAQFDVTTGEAVGKAKVMVFRTMPQNVEKYDVKVDGNDVTADIGQVI